MRPHYTLHLDFNTAKSRELTIDWKVSHVTCNSRSEVKGQELKAVYTERRNDHKINMF